MPAKKNYRNLHDKVASRPWAAGRLAKLRADTLAEIGLYELRRALEQSQVDLAETLGVSQSAVSQLENSDDVKLSTLRSYIEGLGGSLQVTAVFGSGDAQTAVPIQIGEVT